MDQLKKNRKLLRIAVTKWVNALDAELKKTDSDLVKIEATMPVLENQSIKLSEVDEAIRNLLFDDDEFTEEMLEEDMNSCHDYEFKVSEIRVRVQNLLHPSIPRSTRSDSLDSSSYSQRKTTTKYPKIELRKFGGELKEWLGWWAQYEKIHTDEGLDEADKFTYLIQSMQKGSRAEELVKGYPQSKANYQNAVSALQNRYGKPKLLKQVYVRELISMILMKSREKMALSTLYDRLESHIRSLDSLGVTVEQMGIFLFPMVESSLPEEILVAWQRSSSFGQDGSKLTPPKSELDFLMEFLRNEIDNEEQRKLAKSGFDSADRRSDSRKSKSTEQGNDPFTAAGLFSGSAKTLCVFCDKDHASKNCFAAQKMTMEERNGKLKKKGACFVCLRPGHISKTCKSNVKCNLCGKRHEPLMCPTNPRNMGKAEQKKEDSATTQSNLNCTSEVVLRTVMVKLENPTSKKCKTVRALLDCGSQRSYMLKKTAEDLKLLPFQTLTMNHQLFGGTEVSNTPHGIFDVNLRSVSGPFVMEVRVMDQVTICGNLPRVARGSWLKELKSLKIFVNDLDEHNPREIEFLIGADLLANLLTGKLQRLKNGLLATETRLGWTLMGEFEQPKEVNLAMTSICMTVQSASVCDLWSLDVLGITDPAEAMSQEEKDTRAQQHFIETVKQRDEGMYSVCLPWVSVGVLIPTNLQVAQQRLESTARKLVALGKVEDYSLIFLEWEKEGLISRVTEKIENCHYLPHRAVLKPESKTTPIRPVFDASCKVGRAPSLNGCLEKGPNLLELIPSLLLRFRLGRVGVISDIRKAFQMIEVNEDDRDFLRFLWWENLEQKKMTIYRHNRVVFGMNCSPFLLGAVLSFHFQKLETQFPETIEKLKSSIYVDNCVLSVDTPEEFEIFKQEAIDILKLAGMDLRQWECTGDRTGEVTSVLGLKWNKGEDTLCVDSISDPLPEKISKRVVLSFVHQVFDPLGLLAPVVLVPKLLIQKAWSENRKWDEPLPSELVEEFRLWHSELSDMFLNFSVPRRCTFGQPNGQSQFQLHVFSDASGSAYATVIFLRTEIDDKVEVQLVQAKSRVAPVKKVNIPRLELLGCSIGARLAKSVKKALDMEDVPTWFWTDSTTALSWVKKNDEWGTFVGNRVREILSLTTVEQWKFVPGHLNPADLPSRGVTPRKFLSLKWWEGPSWLKLGKIDWPEQKFNSDPDLVNSERRKGLITSLFCSTDKLWYLVKNSYSVNVRILAFVLRFLKALKTKRREDSITLTVEEIDHAERKLFLLVQQESFNTGDNMIAGLRVCRDEDGLIRVKTKLTNRQDSVGFKTPVLLPNDHPITTQLIREEHVFNCHGGAQIMMGLLREKVWIVKGRLAVKKVIRSCVICQRFTSTKRIEPTPALPENRVKDVTAFHVTGVDLAGPLVLKNNSKVWITIFSCAVYRCVHIELVPAISTVEFLLAFTRFSMRKTRPSIVYSDNGTNFVGAANLFKLIDWDEVQKKTKQQRISWRFNPPSAPWWGGWWERIIRSMKDLLKRMCGHAKLTYQDLETCLCQVEWSLNHRPLTFVTEDSNDFVPLTPAMFLYDLPVTSLPEIEVLTASKLGIKRKNLSVLLDELKDRFRSEYLGLLIQRGNEQKSKPLEIGDLVLIGREDVKRVLWPMGRILELYPGLDGVNRVAKVKTESGELTRPIQRLYPLELAPGEVIFPVTTNGVDASTSTKKHKRTVITEESKPEEMEEVSESEIVKTRSGRNVKKPVSSIDSVNRRWSMLKLG